MAAAAAVGGGASSAPGRPGPRDKFIWNHHLAYGLFRCVSHPGWAPPIAHGFFLQLSASLFGRLLTLTLIGRRSRLYAGARLLKRGLCEAGHVANEVEVEQIVADGVRGSLHEGGMTSAVQLRGSIPLTWGHGEQQRHMVPRPDIHLQSIDPTYTYTLRHFTDVHQRYGGPIFVFDLIRQAERRWREKILGRGLADALASLHDRMRREGHPLREGGVRYVPFDFKKESKRKGGDVLQAVERISPDGPRDGLLLEAGLPVRGACRPRRRRHAGQPPERAAARRRRGRLPPATRRRRRRPPRAAVARGRRPPRDHRRPTRRGCRGSRRRARVLRPPRGARASAAAAPWMTTRRTRRTRTATRRRSRRAPPAPGAPARRQRRLACRPAVGPATAVGGRRGEKHQAAGRPPRRRRRHCGGAAARRRHAVVGPAKVRAAAEGSRAAGSRRRRCRRSSRRRRRGGGGEAAAAAAARAAAAAARAAAAAAGAGGAAYALQRGVIRTNCIDCLDRTNVAQFCVGRTLLRRQLSTLGFVLSTDVLEIANALLMRMYEDMGTQLALQYGGSQAVGTPNSNAARDFLQSVKRFYRNTFTDTEKQMIFDVFLGVFPPALSGGTHIWDLDSDLHLHNRPPAHFYGPFYPESLMMARPDAADGAADERGVPPPKPRADAAAPAPALWRRRRRRRRRRRAFPAVRPFTPSTR